MGHRDRGVGSTKRRQAVLIHELRARVVTWPPLRLARLRCERGSVDVVQARWLPKKRWRSHGDHRHGHSSLVRAGGVPARRADQAGAAGRTRSRSSRQVREDAVDRGRGRHRGHRQQRGCRADLAALRQARRRGEFANGSRDRLCASEDRQDRRGDLGQTSRRRLSPGGLGCGRRHPTAAASYG